MAKRLEPVRKSVKEVMEDLLAGHREASIMGPEAALKYLDRTLEARWRSHQNDIARDAPTPRVGILRHAMTRYMSRGYSSTRFQLRMTREEIGNYLGLAVESVSRLLTNFKKTGVIEVNHRDVELCDLAALREVALGNDPCA